MDFKGQIYQRSVKDGPGVLHILQVLSKVECCTDNIKILNLQGIYFHVNF